MLGFTLIEWGLVLVFSIPIYWIGYRTHRKLIIRRLLVIRDELDRIKEKKAKHPDPATKQRELELMAKAERMLGSIGIDPYEHLRASERRNVRPGRP